jgi:hypothetical protein
MKELPYTDTKKIPSKVVEQFLINDLSFNNYMQYLSRSFTFLAHSFWVKYQIQSRHRGGVGADIMMDPGVEAVRNLVSEQGAQNTKA